MGFKSLNIGELLSKAGFDPETGKVVFQWAVRFRMRNHEEGCENVNGDDWCSCPNFKRVVKRIVPWESPLFKTKVGIMSGGWSYGIIEGRDIPESRVRSIELDVMAEDKNAVYCMGDYDGTQWMQKILKRAEDILKAPGYITQQYGKFDEIEDEDE